MLYTVDELRDALLSDRSKKNYERLAAEIGNDSKQFGHVMELFFGGPYRVTHFAAHLLAKCCDMYPNLILPYLGQMIAVLNQDVHDSLKRNVVRTMQFIDIPEEHWDKTVEYCFQLLQSNKEAIAIKVFAMTVLANLCKKLPELKNELRIIIEDQMPYVSAGFKNRGSKILRQLQ